MKNKPSNPPAFPLSNSNIGQQGMTLRDYFAAKAMQSLLMHHDFNWESGKISSSETYSSASIAFVSYELADFMLAEREKQN